MSMKSLYRNLLKISTIVFGVTFTKKMDAKIRFHRNIDLKNPKTLADKLCWLELYVDNPLKVQCSDKYAVREYVKSKNLSDILVPLCGGPYSELDEIDFNALPNQFAMKATHGCAMNLICDDKSKLDLIQTKQTISRWLNEDYSRACIEPHYKKIPHRIICEQFLQDANKIIDYKFHCFHGVPEFILVCSSRVNGVQKRLYTLDWKSIDAMTNSEKCDYEFDTPSQLSSMIKISKTLSEDFDFVRVDLYNIDGKIYFGELTFSPASGVLPNFNEDFITEMGKKLNIN